MLTKTIILTFAAVIAANLTVFIVSYLRFKKAAKKARQARFDRILPTAQTLSAKEQKDLLTKYNSVFFGAFGLAYNEASAKGFKGKDEADAAQIYDLLYWSDVCFFAAKDGLTLRQFICNVVVYCLPVWAFETKQVKQTTNLICEQLNFILSFD